MSKEELEEELKSKNNIESLYYCLDTFNNIAFASSLGAEDQVLTDLILCHKPDARIFTLDTGRLHPETYQLLESTNTRYNTKIRVYFPQADKVEELVNKQGAFSFFESIEKRKECCAIRKLEPLRRALSGLDMWISGLRREQSPTRTDMKFLEWDNNYNLLKINPIIDWSEEQVWDYIKEHSLPYNRLHDEGYPSIGCAPCTRAVKKGESTRSGRWWWEDPSHKECGLHLNRK